MLGSTLVPRFANALERVLGDRAPQDVLAGIVVCDQRMLKTGALRDASNARRLETLFREFDQRRLQNRRAGSLRPLLLSAFSWCHACLRRLRPNSCSGRRLGAHVESYHVNRSHVCGTATGGSIHLRLLEVVTSCRRQGGDAGRPKSKVTTWTAPSRFGLTMRDGL